MDVTRAAGAGAARQAPNPTGGSAGTAHSFPDGLVCGVDSPIIGVRRTCVRVAASQATVLLTGETGTGKEVFARLLHAHSPRARRQFVPVNCGAIPENLLESELFGYVKGAFTGAVTPRRGRVALAEGGTLFLDEVGELPLSLQVKLLRLLQQRTYEPVGSSESVLADFRLVAATNRDLEQEVKAGRFRQDLYYRLNVCPLHLPPLRERRGDVAPLFVHFWRARGEERAIEPPVLKRLEGYEWPGNVRELENLVERVSVVSESAVIRLEDLPEPFFAPAEEGTEGISTVVEFPLSPFASGPPTPAPVAPSPFAPAEASTFTPVAPSPAGGRLATPRPLPATPAAETSALAEPAPMAPMSEAPAEGDDALVLPVNLPVLLRELEEAYIAKALARTGGNKKEAARLLGLGRTTLVEKLRRRNSDTSSP